PGELVDVSSPKVTFVERPLALVSKRTPKNQSSRTVPRRPMRRRYRSRSRSCQSFGFVGSLLGSLPPRYSYRKRRSPKGSNSVSHRGNFHFSAFAKSGTSFSTYDF